MDILVLVGDEITKNQELREKILYEQKCKQNEDFEVVGCQRFDLV
jgi:hypothetical protein